MKSFKVLLLTMAFVQAAAAQGLGNARGRQGGGWGPAPDWLHDEQVLSKTLDLHQQGRDQILPIRKTLDITVAYRGEFIKSVIVIAKTKAGRGNMSLLADGSPLDRKIVGTSFSSYEMPVNLKIGQGVRQLQLETDGNFLIQSLLVVMSNGSRHEVQPLKVEASVNRFGFSLEANTLEEILRQCMQEVRSLQSQRPNFKVNRVTANGVAMGTSRGDQTTIHEACQFIADQAQ